MSDSLTRSADSATQPPHDRVAAAHGVRPGRRWWPCEQCSDIGPLPPRGRLSCDGETRPAAAYSSREVYCIHFAQPRVAGRNDLADISALPSGAPGQVQHRPRRRGRLRAGRQRHAPAWTDSGGRREKRRPAGFLPARARPRAEDSRAGMRRTGRFARGRPAGDSPVHAISGCPRCSPATAPLPVLIPAGTAYLGQSSVQAGQALGRLKLTSRILNGEGSAIEFSQQSGCPRQPGWRVLSSRRIEGPQSAASHRLSRPERFTSRHFGPAMPHQGQDTPGSARLLHRDFWVPPGVRALVRSPRGAWHRRCSCCGKRRGCRRGAGDRKGWPSVAALQAVQAVPDGGAVRHASCRARCRTWQSRDHDRRARQR